MLGLLILALLAAPALWYSHGVLRLAVAYKAKILCSGVFVAGRKGADVLENDLALDNHRWFRLIPAAIDHRTRSVMAGWPRYVSARATYRPGIGSALIHTPTRTIQVPSDPSDSFAFYGTESWPVDRGSLAARLTSVVGRAFSDPVGQPAQRTRAIVIVHRGHIVAERYAPGFGPDSPIAGWSLAKMVMNSLVGILVRQGKIALSDPVPVAAWSHADDPRRTITIEHLLRMTTGLRFAETYRNLREDVLQMLFGEPDSAGYAAAKPLAWPVGSRWQYSGGTTNILSGVIRTVLGERAYATFPRHALFGPLGMDTAVLEMDAAGNFVCSSFMYATARDWARLGMLYLCDGVRQGQRILPEGWVDYSRTPTPQSPNGVFGAHLWRGVSEYYRDRGAPAKLPADAFHGIGYEGQFVSVVPSEKLVVVRLGMTRRPQAWLHESFLRDVIAAIAEYR